MYLISYEKIRVLYVLVLIVRQTPTIICWQNSVLIILEHDITVNAVTLRLDKVLGSYHQTKQINNTYQLRLSGDTCVQLLIFGEKSELHLPPLTSLLRCDFYSPSVCHMSHQPTRKSC